MSEPPAKQLLDGIGRGAIVSGIAQSVTDWFFHPELTPSQRVGRVAIAAAVGVGTAVAARLVLAAIGVTSAGIVATALTAAVIGIAFDAIVTKPFIYPTFGFGK